MEFKHHLETAWKTLLDHLASLIILTLAVVATGVFSLGILAPVAFAGYVHAIIRLVREGREPKPEDVFSQMKLFLPLFFFGVAVFVGSMIGFALLFFPGVIFLLLVSFACMYTIPLMVEREMGLMDAVSESYHMVTKDGVSDHIVTLIIFGGISAVGSSFLLGILFAQPIATIFLVSVYLGLVGERGEPGAEEPPAEPDDGAEAA